MNFKKIISIYILSIPFTANAALINADWKVKGDGLAVYDDETGNSWIDLSQTKNLSPYTVENGTIYNEWNIANESEINRLYSLFIEKEYRIHNTEVHAERFYYDDNMLFSNNFFSLFGITAYLSNSIKSCGILLNDSNDGYLRNCVNSITSQRDSMFEYGKIDYSSTSKSSYYGIFLYSNINSIVGIDGYTEEEFNSLKDLSNNTYIPIGKTSQLIGLSLMGFAFRRKIKR